MTSPELFIAILDHGVGVEYKRKIYSYWTKWIHRNLEPEYPARSLEDDKADDWEIREISSGKMISIVFKE